MTTVSTHAYARAHAEIFLSDRMRNLLKDLVRSHGLDPTQLVDQWTEWIDNAVRTWLRSGHLRQISIEFYKPGAVAAVARWDFPIRYDGSGIGDMWVDDDFFADTLAKAARPPAGCDYRVLLLNWPGAATIPGLGPAPYKSLAGLTARDAGTVIATPFMTAGARYYR